MRRLETLKRLGALYEVVEEMHSMELQRMITAVLEIQQAIGVQQEMLQSARLHEREALKVGDRMEWAMAEALQETSGLRRRRLDEVRVVREDFKNRASEQYVASRLKSEQMNRVVDRITEQIEVESARRAQAVSDDRFLSRRRWTEARLEARADTEIKGS
jgi:hypothetical protein